MQPTIELTDGSARHMGDGTLALHQIDDAGQPRCIIILEADLLKLLAAIGG